MTVRGYSKPKFRQQIAGTSSPSKGYTQSSKWKVTVSSKVVLVVGLLDPNILPELDIFFTIFKPFIRH